MGGSLADLSAFMVQQQQMMIDREAQLRADLKAERLELEAKLEQQRQQTDEQRREWEAKVEQQRREIETLRAENLMAARPQLASEMVDEGQLAALQSRLQAMHAAKLLTDEELFSLEDAVVDCVEVLPTAGASAPEVEKIVKMLLVVAKVASDNMLARQLRRKFL